MALLFIYDIDFPGFVGGDRDYFDRVVYKLGVTNNGANLLSTLDSFVANHITFDRIYIMTHGGPGMIGFGSTIVDSCWISTNMAGRGYNAICPSNTRIYFGGCNVAQGSAGTEFLRSVASVFLSRGGGSVFAYTSMGFSHRFIPIWTHSIHFSGDLKTIYVAPGGRIIEEHTQSVLRSALR